MYDNYFFFARAVCGRQSAIYSGRQNEPERDQAIATRQVGMKRMQDGVEIKSESAEVVLPPEVVAGVGADDVVSISIVEHVTIMPHQVKDEFSITL